MENYQPDIDLSRECFLFVLKIMTCCDTDVSFWGLLFWEGSACGDGLC